MNAIQLAARLVGYTINVLGAERALAVVDGKARAVGLPTENFWMTADLSQTILKDLIEGGTAMILRDAGSQYREANSAILSATRSILFAPCSDTEGRLRGFVYADHQSLEGAFTAHHLLFARKFVHDKIEPGLEQLVDSKALSWERVQAAEWITS